MSRRVLQGTVVSIGNAKTCVVRVDRTLKHPKYLKLFHQSKRYAVHDPNNQAVVGGEVEIEETRPISKTKKWRLVKVLNAGQ
ncbi:30S ribosomal protein S17 [Candidatus Uhrbacteria bacterium]|nr:30S ribosomal protein S17 [Candidatus Uhrbacteria bacterium]